MGEKRQSPFSLALVAGGCAGTSVDVALHPIDTIRTRLQAREGFWKAGGFRGVYQGLLAITIGSAPGAAVFFSTYETMKRVLKDVNGGEEAPIQHSIASSCGEVAACMIRVPTAVIAQNMQIGKYAKFTEACSETWAAGGLRAFYTGYGTTVMREIPFSFIQFPIYERFKKVWKEWQGKETNPVQGAVCGSVAGAIAGAITTPLDLVKTRIVLDATTPEDQKKYRGTVQTLRKIYTEEGALKLFSGISTRVTWITIGGFIFFGAYESATSMLWKTGLW